jgi:AraC-like DNA-binding protein
MLKYCTYNPPRELTDYVRFFWSLDAEVISFGNFVHRALPDNCFELIFYPVGQFSISSLNGAEGNTFRSGIFGQADKFRLFKTDRDFSLFGVYLYPYSLPQFFNLPAHELTTQMVDSKTLWGIEGEILEEKVVLAADHKTRVEIVSNFLINRLKKMREARNSRFIYCVKKIISNNQLLSIPSFASDCNLSRRQFERKFKEFSGFSPNEFFRIVRFKGVLKDYSNQRNKTLVQIALDNGYYDQSHLTHDFKKYSGYNPKEFFINCPVETDTRATQEFKI